MLKRVFGLVLALAMVLSMVVMPTYAKEEKQENVTAPESACPCGCGASLADVEWEPWDVNTVGSVATGHFYLEDDYLQAKQYSVSNEKKVVLDLRGHTLTTAEEGRLFLIYGYMAVMDTVGGGLFAAKPTGTGNGGLMMVSKEEGAAAGGLFELYSGTVVQQGENGGADGGVAVIAAGSTFRMYGGKIVETTAARGGAFAVRAEGNLEILGGGIYGCTASGVGGAIYSLGNTVIENCQIWGGVSGSYGGNILQPGGNLVMENVDVAYGEAHGASNGGGNICAYAGTSQITNCRIYSGYTKYNGGNLFLGSGTHTVKDCVVFGGTAENSGGNLATINSNAKLTIDNCSFTGDVRITRGTITFKNKVTIGLLNTGLNLMHTDGVTAKVDFSGLTEGSEIYVNAGALFTKGSVNAAYFKGALRTVITETDEGLVGAQAEDGTVSGYCPHCNTQVAWSAFSTTGSVVQECYHDADEDTDPTCTGKHMATGHYYLTQDYSSFIQYRAGAYRNSTALASADVVLDLNGFDLGGSYRAFYLHPGKGDVPDSTLTLLDSCGGSVVSGDGSDAQGGGVIFNEGSNLNIYGGKYVYKVSDKRVVNGGAVLFNSGVLNIYGGTFDASAYENAEYNGGAIVMYNNDKVLNISGGMFIGGNTQYGGTVYAGYNNTISITGGIFVGGKAAIGGNLRLYSDGTSNAKGTLEMRDCAFRDGHATKSAGNMDIQQYTINVENCLFSGGSADSYAGNVNFSGKGQMTLDGCVLLGGTSVKGGNLYFATTNTDILVKDCYLYGGVATTGNGGNLLANNGRCDIKNTEFAFGSATGGYGGNIYANAGNASATSNNYTRLGMGTMLVGGKANYGGNISCKGVTFLDDVTILGGEATYGKDAYMSSADKQQRLVIGESCEASFDLYVNSSHLSDPVYGNPITNTECTVLNASIRLENLEDMPLLKAVNGQLGLGSVCVMDANGNAEGFDSVEEAIAACDENSYVKVLADTEIVLTKDCAVDMNGCNVTVSGAYTLKLMDSTGDDFTEPEGTATVAAETTVSKDHTAPNGNRYLVLDNKAHRIALQLTNVNIRPAANGLYYTGAWGADDTVKAMLDTYGMAVSLTDMPDGDFATEGENLWTEFAAADMVSGEKKPGVIIEGILAEDNDARQNDWNAKANIFATAYMKLKDGTVLTSDAPGYGDDIYYSVYSVLKTLDTLLETSPKQFGRNTRPARAFYEQWAEVMGAWELKEIPTPEDDGVIDVLMIGNSFCTYFTEELYAIAKAAGVKMRVCNLYYGGCSLEQHYTWWQTDDAPYTFYNVDENGRVSTKDVSLEWALAQGEWDILSIQEVSSRLRHISAAEGLEMTKTYRDALIPYLRDRFPSAQLYWHQTWAYQKGYNTSSYQCLTTETQKTYAARQEEFSLAVCEQYGIPRVPSGIAWEIIRDGGYDEMCDRLGKADGDDPHAGDYYHDGDIGGGQYLNACVWFETITGMSVIGNTYVPTYTYGGETFGLNAEITVEELQAAAHAAVESIK
ncbi:MAG: DUF4886 domain-containing protein [Oscillospiraceae bacterium]|nr:DUF4886 domain-containing protein [Oscillospiraceae bacterium]